MSSDTARIKRGQIDRLVTLLAQDVHSHVGGRGFAPKLIQTAVNVLSKDVATSQDKLDRVSMPCCMVSGPPCVPSQPRCAMQDVATAKKAFAQSTTGGQFEQHLQALLDKG